MEVTGWGRTQRIEAEVQRPWDLDQCPAGFLARGAGRSYGDASLAANVLSTQNLNRFQSWDSEHGVLGCEAGLSLSEILELVIPRGWILPVLPGTRFVTVGGAIAGDVHGKNHPWAGSFSRHVLEMDLLLADGLRLKISRHDHPELFSATCGGQGLTGVILSARLKLERRQGTEFAVTTRRTQDLATTLQALENRAPYAVGWIDGFARGTTLGRGRVQSAQWSETGPQSFKPKSYPFPARALAPMVRPIAVQAFNACYFMRPAGETRSSLHSFLFPLDSLSGWNRLYGANGFLQFQSALPKGHAEFVISQMLNQAHRRGLAPYLVVVKRLGSGEPHPLSFASEGLTVAMDFPFSALTRELFAEYEKLTLAHDGRVNLSKDATLSLPNFRRMYPRWSEFETIRQTFGGAKSVLAERLGFL